MLVKTFKIDVTKCQACQGDLRKIGAVVDGGEVQRYLKHVGLDHAAPPRGPLRGLYGGALCMTPAPSTRFWAH